MQPMHSLEHIGHRYRDLGKIMRLFVLLLAFLLPWNVVICEQSAVNSLISLQKRIDYRTCIDRFDVHRDTIIQTDDSRKMGASFIYHVEAVNRDECLRKCCETDRCDVFVFEEKYQGSCFLFECGPPDDFRCQFAAHANYSIAVLSVHRYKETIKPQVVAPPPPESPHLSQHEMELDSLKSGRESFKSYRMPEMGNKLIGQPNEAPPTSTTTTTIAPPTTQGACGRFQFKCHSGECIAIYNACDGIPQCEDGSDETPACPPQPGMINTNKKHISQMEEPPRYQVYPQVQQPQHRPDEHVNSNNMSPDRTRPIQYPAKMYEGSDAGGGGGYMSGTIEKPPPLIRNREDPLSGPRFYPVNHNNQQQQQIQPPQSQSSWNQNIPMQMMGKDMPIQDTMNTNNMIYNSNDPDNNRLVYDTVPVNRLPNSNSIPSGPAAGPHPMDYYSNGGYRDKYNIYPTNRQQQPPSILQPIVNIPSNIPRPWQNPSADAQNAFPGQQLPQSANNYPLINPNNIPNNNNNNGNNNWPTAINNNNLPPVTLNLNNNAGQSQQPSPHLPQISPNSAPQSIPVVSGNPIPSPKNPPASQNNVKPPVKAKAATKDESEEDSESAEEVETTEAAPRKGKSRGKHRKLDKGVDNNNSEQGMPTFPPLYQQLKAIGSELDGEIMDHDGASDRPTGAVVSLVIGVSITAVLAIFIGCRMKTVGRRIRRTGKGPYAHDADFLVNGMYL